MLLPLRTDRPLRRTPVVTQGLLVANLLVFVAILAAEFGGAFDRDTVVDLGRLGRADFRPWQLVTYQFLHDPYALLHIGANMLFLWVFGCAVEDRLGRLGFLGFYLAGGMVAGLAHMATSPAPVIGASGSVAAVTGAFLALFPRSRIVAIWLLGFISVPAVVIIGLYFAIDVLRMLGETFRMAPSGVAYTAHLAGYVYGFGVCFVLLATGVVKRAEFDVFFLFRQWRRRTAFRAASRGDAAGMFESASADTGRRLERQRQRAAETPERAEVTRARAAIAERIAAHDVADAARRYQALLQEAPDAVLAEPHQLDVANQLYREGAHEDAARAYELLLGRHPRSSHGAEVRLLLAVLYARRLDRPARARELVEAARPRLRDEAQTSLADELLRELPA